MTQETDVVQMEMSMTCFENNCSETFNGNDCKFDTCVAGIGSGNKTFLKKKKRKKRFFYTNKTPIK